ncbi:MAG: guanylate kinase [Candidatus Dasytiphilus stammeri]
MNQGILFIISAPSGAGKSSIIQALLKMPQLNLTKLAVSHTTRKKRPGEINGSDYYFISNDAFQRMIQQGLFIEYAEIFGSFYGTSHVTINELLTSSINILLDINWQGAQQIRKKIPLARSIYILPPSKIELTKRLYCRGQDSYESIENRIKEAVNEMKHYLEYDYLIINNNYNLAIMELNTIIKAENLKMQVQILRNKKIINDLLK